MRKPLLILAIAVSICFTFSMTAAALRVCDTGSSWYAMNDRWGAESSCECNNVAGGAVGYYKTSEEEICFWVDARSGNSSNEVWGQLEMMWYSGGRDYINVKAGGKWSMDHPGGSTYFMQWIPQYQTDGYYTRFYRARCKN